MSLEPSRQEQGVILRQERSDVPISESSETKILHALTDTLREKQPELLDHFLGTGYFQAWAGVLIGVKPGEYALAEYNKFMLNRLYAADPEIAGHFDVIAQEEAVLAPQEVADGQAHEPRNWLVNRAELTSLVKENSDLFGALEGDSYDQAKSLVTKMLQDPQKGHLVTGMLYGYPRADCEDWAELVPIFKLLSGRNSKADLKNSGFGNKESEFIDKYALSSTAPYVIKKAVATLLSRRIPMTKTQKSNLTEAIRWEDKSGSTRWTGFKKNAVTAVNTLNRIDAGFLKTGMGNLVSSLSKR